MKYQAVVVVLCALLCTFVHVNGRHAQGKAGSPSSQHQTGNSNASAVGGDGGDVKTNGTANNNNNDASLNVDNSGGKGGNLASLGGQEVHNHSHSDSDSGSESFQGGTADLNVGGGDGGDTSLNNTGNGNNNTALNINSSGGDAGNGYSKGGEARSKVKARHHLKGSDKHRGKHENQKLHH